MFQAFCGILLITFNALVPRGIVARILWGDK